MTQKMPAHAARLLMPRERVRYLTRPRLLPLYMLLFMAAVVLGLILFSVVIEDPGFMRLLSIPAIPVLGGFAGHLLHSPVILVTERRLVSASRFQKPLILDLAKLETMRVKQSLPGRLLGYGALELLFRPPRDLGEGVFLKFVLKELPDVSSLGSAILMVVEAIGVDGEKKEDLPTGL